MSRTFLKNVLLTELQILLIGAQRRNRTTDTGIFSPLLYRLSYLGMVGLSGLEPPASRLSGVRSNQLSYKPISNIMLMVGVAGFEPAALWSQTRCATKLRYTPK